MRMLLHPDPGEGGPPGPAVPPSYGADGPAVVVGPKLEAMEGLVRGSTVVATEGSAFSAACSVCSARGTPGDVGSSEMNNRNSFTASGASALSSNRITPRKKCASG